MNLSSSYLNPRPEFSYVANDRQWAEYCAYLNGLDRLTDHPDHKNNPEAYPCMVFSDRVEYELSKPKYMANGAVPSKDRTVKVEYCHRFIYVADAIKLLDMAQLA
jgi:hypothetical protein